MPTIPRHYFCGAGGGMGSPLSDVRVVEVTNFVAAPSAGAVLADFGADVVKIERCGATAGAA
jgi:crotonobetainyl-CoA:carnitine CoA-transferase CaiB-like acyl-CoA transferase